MNNIGKSDLMREPEGLLMLLKSGRYWTRTNDLNDVNVAL